MYHAPEFKLLGEQIRSATAADVEEALTAHRLGLNGLAALLSPAAEPYLPEMAKRSSDITRIRFGKTTQLYPPPAGGP